VRSPCAANRDNGISYFEKRKNPWPTPEPRANNERQVDGEKVAGNSVGVTQKKAGGPAETKPPTKRPTGIGLFMAKLLPPVNAFPL
jgi:hypothetical protein